MDPHDAAPAEPPQPALTVDLFDGLTEEEFAAAQDELGRGCGWG